MTHIINKIIRKLQGKTYPYMGVSSAIQDHFNKNFSVANVDVAIDIVLLTLNRLTETKRTLDSLYQSTTVKFKLIIIDQKSDDGTREFLQEFVKSKNNAELILLEENTGVSGGRAFGVEKVQNKYTAFIDNDMVFCKGYFENLVSKLEEDEKIAAVLGKIILPNEEIQLNHPAVIDEKEWIIFKDLDQGKKFDDVNTNQPVECDWMPGVAIWRSDVLKNIKIDPDFIGAYEDNEYSLRVREAGYKFVNYPSAMVLHIRADFTKALEDKNYTKGRFNQDKLRFAAKRFYERYGKLLAVGDKEGSSRYFGFQDAAEYNNFVKS